jgi:hypothetical protein
MPFDDIDTPIPESELGGEEAPPAAEPAAPEPPADDEPAAAAATENEPGEGDDKPAQEEPPQERSAVIPRGRFDEVNSKLHAEREENARLRAQLEASAKAQPKAPEAPAPVEKVDLEQEYYEAVQAGDRDKALAVRAQINAEIEARAEEKAAARVGREFTEREQRNALNSAATKAIQSYPFLDSSAADANTEAIAEVVEWRDFYAAKGEPVHVALEKAVAKVAPMYAKPAPVEPPVPTQDGRRQAAAVRNLREAGQQPPAPSAGIGNRAAPAEPKIESQKDWESLSAEQRERMLAG